MNSDDFAYWLESYELFDPDKPEFLQASQFSKRPLPGGPSYPRRLARAARQERDEATGKDLTLRIMSGELRVTGQGAIIPSDPDEYYEWFGKYPR